ncbi:5732_t:CDS:2 [Acaulospora colombiana]|uniref:5732_t:CDS:1 n=1 Tax=Acaulospora colombiana TaxID=27376 RepID=A0ACA9L007_9GLOM|nr:5732_t:CDS:2 [Acaulospora colombiana]
MESQPYDFQLNDENRRITICSSYHNDLNNFEQDAKMLTTPKIVKKIDDMLRNPQLVKQSKRSSVGSDARPITELDSPNIKITTTTYTLTNVPSDALAPAPQVNVTHDY